MSQRAALAVTLTLLQLFGAAGHASFTSSATHLRAQPLVEVAASDSAPVQMSMLERSVAWVQKARSYARSRVLDMLDLQQKSHPLVLLQGQQPQQADPQGQMFWSTISGGVFFALGAAVLAHLYKEHKYMPNMYDNTEKFTEFQTGLCGFFDDLPGFCFAMSCMGIRWADSVSMVAATDEEIPSEPRKPIMAFWIAFWVAMALIITSNAGISGGLMWIVTACVFTHFRQKMRKSFGMESSNEIVVKDCLSYFCCGFCAVAQDARHIEAAKQHEHPAIVV